MLEKFLLALSLTFALNLFIKIGWPAPKNIGDKINSSAPAIVILTQRSN